MPNLKTGKDCCGCTACAAVCGHSAIIMQPDSLGFKYPKVDMAKCVECGLCERVCSFNSEYKTPDNYKQPIPYGCRLKSTDELMKSRSGGAFVALSDLILDKGGVVYGVGYKQHFKVAHKRATTKEERDEFRGSKYVQTDLDGIFTEVRKDLMERKWVMFTGTGCQVAGLKAFIPTKLQEKLITVDIVCHGVPSPKIWEDYIKYLEEREGGEIDRVDFRNKKFGWNTHKETYYFSNPHKEVSNTTYTHLYFTHLTMRSSCEQCFFCNIRRPGDLTLADFWGWEKTGNQLNSDNKGLSLVFVNTPKGHDIFKESSHQLEYFQPKLEDCMQSHLIRPTKGNPKAAKFQREYETKGFEDVLKKYGNISLKYKIKLFISLTLRKLKIR